MKEYEKKKAEWAKQRKEIVRMARKMTCREIGNVLGISAQRVHQIIKIEREKQT